MRALAIFVCTLIGGVVLGAIVSVAALFGLDVLHVSPHYNRTVLLILSPISFIVCAWVSIKWITPKSLAAGTSRNKGLGKQSVRQGRGSMQVLAILVWTAIGGSILFGLMSTLAVSALDHMRAPAEVIGIMILVALPIAFLVAGWGSSRLFPPRPLQETVDAKSDIRQRWAAIGIGVAALLTLILGIQILEYRAEANAKKFCDPSLVGTPMAQVAESAKGTGTDMLRHIRPDSVNIGFTGLPPFSRHLCTVEGRDGLVTKVSYSYLD